MDGVRRWVRRMRDEARAGTPVGYAFALVVGVAAAALVFWWDRSTDDASGTSGGSTPWPALLLFVLIALAGPLRATWRRRRAARRVERRPEM